MNISNVISIRVFKIIQKQRFVKDILNSIIHQSGKALLVGGAVRDLFLDIAIKDLDFEVYGLTLEQLQKTLEEYGTVSLVGKSFGVLRLHGLDIDWSLPRKDSSGRHPVVAHDPNMSYEQAFARRDLTINAMGIDMQTLDLIDPFGGIQDLESKILRAPDLNFFGQDPLRLLRVMQFIGRFEMTVDYKLSQVCAAMDMSKISQERIEQEFLKLFLQAKRPSLGLQWLVLINKFHEFLPGVEICELLFLKLDCAATESYSSNQEKIAVMWSIIVSFLDCEIDPIFAQLNKKDTQTFVDFMKRLTRHDKTITQVVKLVFYAQGVDDCLTDVQIKWLALWLAPETSIRLISKFIGIGYSDSISNFLINRSKKLGVIDYPEAPLLTGKDFLDVAKGARLGVLVKKAYQLQIDQGLVDRFVLKRSAIELKD